MEKIHESVGTVQFHHCLVAATGRAWMKYQTARERIEKALALVEADAVTDMTRIRPYWYTVRSASEPDQLYDVLSNGTTVCSCEDYRRHGTHNPEYFCKHAMAVLLVRAARRDMRKGIPVGYVQRAYHWVSGEEGHARQLSNGRVQFYPGGHKYSFVCDHDEVCLGPVLAPTETRLLAEEGVA